MLLPCKIAVSVLAVIITLSDIRSRRIPNVLPLALAMTAVMGSMLTGVQSGWREALLVFLAGYLLYRVRLMGGGDVKTMTAGALLLPGKLAMFCFVTAVTGGIVALLCLCHGWIRRVSAPSVPYGAAISAGLLYCVWSN